MKPLLYAGALLMVGASIYGFVDYKKTSRDSRFKTLYQKERIEKIPDNATQKMEEPEKLVLAEKEKVIVVNKQSATTKQTKLKRAKKLNSKLYSRAALESYEPVKTEETPSAKETEKEK